MSFQRGQRCNELRMLKEEKIYQARNSSNCKRNVLIDQLAFVKRVAVTTRRLLLRHNFHRQFIVEKKEVLGRKTFCKFKTRKKN